VEEGNTLSLTVSRSDGSHGEASVSYRIAYGSADANDVAPLTGTLHWAAGQSDSQTISIPVKSDTLREGTRPSPWSCLTRAARPGRSAPDPGDHQGQAGAVHHSLARASMTVNEGQWFAEIPWCAAAI
jgi:hypothetical protein